jgi:hypothetical protein
VRRAACGLRWLIGASMTDPLNHRMRAFVSAISSPQVFVVPRTNRTLRVAIPKLALTNSARTHIGTKPGTQQFLFFGAIIFLLGNGNAPRRRRLLCLRRWKGKCCYHKSKRAHARSATSNEVSPLHPTGFALLLSTNRRKPAASRIVDAQSRLRR